MALSGISTYTLGLNYDISSTDSPLNTLMDAPQKPIITVNPETVLLPNITQMVCSTGNSGLYLYLPGFISCHLKLII